MKVDDRDFKAILFTQEEISARVKQLAAQISGDYGGEDFIAVGLLTGVVPFYVDLMMEIQSMVDFCFILAKSYGNGSHSTGNVRIECDMNLDVKGKRVLLIDDIIDSGNTLKFVTGLLAQRGAADIKTCCLLDKKQRRTADINCDYVGFEIPDEFVVGYGLDYAGKYRNMRYIAALEPNVYTRRMDI